MDNLSMYLMVIASSTYASINNRFKSIQPSTVTVGTIAAIDGSSEVSFSSESPSSGSVGTVVASDATVSNLFESTVDSDIIIGTIAALEVTNTGMFQTDLDNMSITVGGQTTAAIDATITNIFVADDAAATRSEMYRELTQEESGPPPAPVASVDSYFASTSLLINGE